MITVFGSVNLDLIGSVGRLPRPGETVSGGAFATAPGGKGANQALAAARAGASVRMVGAVGQDSFADQALVLLREGGVDLSRVRSVAAPTGVALILVDAAGENVIAVMPGANNTVSSEDVEGLDFGPEDVLLLQLEAPVAGVTAAAARAKAAGANIVLNFAPFRPEALPLLRHITHLVVNESECELILDAEGVPPDRLAGRALELAHGYGIVVCLTLGKDGVFTLEGDNAEWAPALAVEAIDTVGAGDTFCGYLAAALSEGMTAQRASYIAAAAGSLACTKSGAQPAIPFRDEVDRAKPLTPA
jgi:ribokinase